MEKLNLNFNGGDNIIKTICWIMSILSWLLLLVTGWISFIWLNYTSYDSPKVGIVWTIQKYYFSKILDKIDGTYEPIQMQVSFIYIVFILAMIITLTGFIIYLIKSTCKRDEAVYNGMMGQWSKFHFFPLLCISALFIIGETYDGLFQKISNIIFRKNDYADRWKARVISAFVFTIIGLASLIFIYIMTDLNADWYVILTLKKGTYSCFITLLWYNFCYLIYRVREVHYFDYNSHDYKDFNKDNWKKGCGLAFSIIFGIGSLIFAFIFKDLIVAGMNSLIYLGLAIYYFKLDETVRKDYNKNGDGIVDVIMVFLSAALILFLVLTKRDYV